jgi:hypothetical protein
MQTIEIQKGIRVGFEEMINGAAKLETSDLEVFMEKLGQLLARRKTPRINEREIELINIIYDCLTLQNESRYEELNEKLHSKTLSSNEHAELIEFNDLAEEQQIEYLKSLLELSQIRGVTVEKTIHQLGIDKMKKRA